MPKQPHRPLAKKPKHIIDRLIFFVALTQPLAAIPQIIAIYTRQDAHSLSLLSWIIYLVFDIMWLWYGVTDKQRAVIVSAVMFATLDGFTLVSAFIYGATL
jgi:uncharacterized protein with PQ loop repeat